MNFKTVAFHAERMLSVFHPDALSRPAPVDLLPLLHDGDQLLAVHVEHEPPSAMGTIEGLYEPEARRIVLRSDVWAALVERSPMTHRARATFAHELGHHALFAHSQDEEDAWAFAGCLMMPCEMVMGLSEMCELDDIHVSRVFDVSAQFALKHLLRMKQARML